MDVEAHLYPRKAIERLGIAPLTSMYQHGENDRRVADDFRPEIHDSDGLLMWRGNGEWLWRPLLNPRELRVNAYLDENPRGFGLLQRDRDFASYQDAGAHYHERPDLWVEPLEPWGRGAVQLVEIPTGEEIFDNIVAFWNPERPAGPGAELRLARRDRRPGGVAGRGARRLAGEVRPPGGRGAGAGGPALHPAARAAGAERDLDLPVDPAAAGSGMR